MEHINLFSTESEMNTVYPNGIPEENKPNAIYIIDEEKVKLSNVKTKK